MDFNDKPPPYSPHAPTVASPPPYQPPPVPYNCSPQYGVPITAQSGIPTYGAVTVPVNTTIIVGGCPVCRMGILQDSYPCCAICLAIVCFPLGVCCCLAMKQRECTNCGATFH